MNPIGGTKTEKASAGSRDYVSALANAVSRLTSGTTEDVLARVPAILVEDFEAARAELWLWDESSDSVYLTHAAGKQFDRRQNYCKSGAGALGRVAQALRPLENAVLATFAADDQVLAESTGLARLAAYPLVGRPSPTSQTPGESNDRLLGIIANYAPGEVPEELLRWWRTYADISTFTLQDALAAQQSRKALTQLSLLFEASKLLNSTLDLPELLDLILKIARSETKADRGTVFLVDHKNRELWSIVASGLEHQEIRVPFGKGVAGRVGQTGETVNVEDAYGLEFFDRSFDRKFGYQTKSLLCLPVRHQSGEIVGVIQLLNKTGEARFSADDREFLARLSGHMALALENARLHRDALERQRSDRELALARGIQHGLLPEVVPVVPGFEIAVRHEPCFEVGGDYYDFLNLGPQSLLLVIADVQGKGIASALAMSNLQATLRALVLHLHSLEVLALSINEMMCNYGKGPKYLSIFLGLVDTRRNGLHYINAGHVPPILVSGDTGQYKELLEGGPVLGVVPKTEYRRGSVQLRPGDLLVCCTDGVLAAVNEKEEGFSAAHLARCVVQNRSKSAEGIAEAVSFEVNRFASGTHPADISQHADDKVLMVVKVSKPGIG